MDMTLPDDTDRRPEESPARRAVLALNPGDRVTVARFGWFAVRSSLGEALHVHLMLEPARVVGDGGIDRVLLDSDNCDGVFREAEAVARRLSAPAAAFLMTRSGWTFAVFDGNGRVAGSGSSDAEYEAVAQLFAMTPDVIRAYAAPSGLAHADDRFPIEDPWGHVELARRLGFEYPFPAAQRALRIQPGDPLVTKDGVMRVVQVEGLRAFLMTAGRAQPVRNPLPLELDQITQWRPVLHRHEAERIIRHLGDQLHQAERPMSRDERLKLAQRARDRLWNPDDLAQVLVNLAAATKAREWLSPVETKNRDAAKKHLVAELSAATAEDPSQVEQRLADLGY
jgi:hypothetical protein